MREMGEATTKVRVSNVMGAKIGKTHLTGWS